MNRKYGIDLAKVFAMIMVITVHHFSFIGFYNEIYNGGAGMFILTGLYLVALSGVPIFLISSGYLLGKNKPTKNYYKKLAYFIIEFIIITFIGMAISLTLKDSFTLIQWLSESVKFIINPNYYIGLYISTYLVGPFINNIFLTNSYKNQKIFIFILCFVISLPSLLNKFPGFNFFDPRPTSMWAVLYYSIGVFLQKNRIKLSSTHVICILLLTIFSYSFLISNILSGKVYSHFFGYYESIFLVVLSTSIFVLFSRVTLNKNKVSNVIVLLSSGTLTFYLCSTLYSDRFSRQFINLSGTLIFDLFTTIKMVTISILVSLPVVIIVGLIMRKIVNKTLKFYIK